MDTIKNVNDPHVIQIAKFAVSENKMRSKIKLELVAVVRGATKVVSGMNYRLLLKATDGTATNLYRAIVYEKAWEGYKKLAYFEPAQGFNGNCDVVLYYISSHDTISHPN
ncbi:auxin-induced in root cultures protein 12-like [Hibiscus syriacus]|uniref:Auxin-induced in root cultures protein 12-like n=1 Tax=Hibiscus syriacus TaxID=106335 RepID=A0A6A2Y617_HIBSY|nr:auxin-induced in root cultures protein 12-like [Hibiscus syriacus]